MSGDLAGKMPSGRLGGPTTMIEAPLLVGGLVLARSMPGLGNHAGKGCLGCS